MTGPSEYELWRDSLMIAATAAASWDPDASLRNSALEIRTMLLDVLEPEPWRVDIEEQNRTLHVEVCDLSKCITAALHIHRPCRSPGDWETVAHCDRSHIQAAEQPDCVGCGYSIGVFGVGWPCPTARALGAT